MPSFSSRMAARSDIRDMAIRLAAAAIAALFLASAAATAAAEPSRVEVTRDDDGWTAVFRFAEASPAWILLRSPLSEVGREPWRPRSWTILTEGVRLERRGHHDVLAAAPGALVPPVVHVRFTPFPGRVVADYDPAITFSDGSVALYSEQFDAAPIPSAAAADEMPPDLQSVPLAPHATRVSFRDAGGPVLHDGERRDEVRIEDDRGSYVYFGPASPVPAEAATLIIDPGLPAWLGDSLRRDTPALLAEFTARMGPPPGSRPTILVGWSGPTADRFSIGGGVLPGQVVMRFEGAALVDPDSGTRTHNLWFIAHETAHFWLGQAIAYEGPRDGWITEGGADLLAIRAMEAVDPAYDVRSMLQDGIDDCIALTRGRGVESALERDEHRAYYACGLVFARVAEAVSGEPYSAFVRRLIERHGADRIISRSEWLASLAEASGGPELGACIERLLVEGSDDPAAALADLLARAGIPHRRTAEGGLILA